MTTKKAAILLAEGFELMEAAVVADVLKRAKCEVKILSTHQDAEEPGCPVYVKSNVGIGLTCDAELIDVMDGAQFTENGNYQGGMQLYDAVVVPGGMPGSVNLQKNRNVLDFLRAHASSRETIIASICGGPIVLAAAGLLKDREVTCYQGFESELQAAGARYNAVRDVAVDGNIITANGPATSTRWALRLVGELVGRSTAEQIAKDLLVLRNPMMDDSPYSTPRVFDDEAAARAPRYRPIND